LCGAFSGRQPPAMSSSHGHNTVHSAHRVPHHALNLAILVHGAPGYCGDMTFPAPGSTDHARETETSVARLRGRGGGRLGLGRVASSHAQTCFTARGLWSYTHPRLDQPTIGMGRQLPNEMIHRAED
jgi:hypothetical protein